MKQVIKRIMRYLMVFALLFVIVPIEVKANYSTDSITMFISGKSIELRNNQRYLLSDYGISNEETEDYRAYFDIGNKKLYLKNYDNGSIVMYLGFNSTIEIILIGDNKINSGGKSYGIWGSTSGDNIIINSNDRGRLDINVDNENSHAELPSGISSYGDNTSPLGTVKIKGNATVNINVKNEYNGGHIRPHGIRTREFEISDNASLDINVETVSIGDTIGIGYYHSSYVGSSKNILINTNGDVTINTKNTKPEDSFVIFIDEQIKIDKVNKATFVSNNGADTMFRYGIEGFIISDTLDKSISEVDGVTTVVYKSKEPLKAQYEVEFIDYDGTSLKSDLVNEGSSAIAPSNPDSKENHHFIGWDKPFTNVTSNLTVRAEYALNKYTVTFEDGDGVVLDTKIVEHGSDATAPSSPDNKEGYHFTGWDKPFTNITGDLTVKALYEINEYLVTFVDYDGTILDTQTVKHGSAATAPSNPDNMEGYYFSGWDKDFTNIKSAVDIIAVYKKEEVPPTYTYKIISGANQTWEHGSEKDIVIKVDAPKDKFKGLEYNGGLTIDKKYFKIEEGSTIITILAEYLESLTVGEKNIHILYSDHEPIQTTFTIKAKPAGTGDEQTTPEQPKEEEKPKEEKPSDKLPGMGDSNFLSYLALLLMVLGGLFVYKTETHEE